MKFESIDKLHKLFLECKGVCTDTRKISEGVLFIALVGDNFDGNKFVNTALEKGAKFALVSDITFSSDDRCIVVEDTLIALQDLSSFHRNYLNIPILALTGSNGKTTTKELCAHVLGQRFRLKYTKGNLNNHIGVPLTLLSFDKSIDFGIVEMGANHLKEIARLCEIAKPNFGLITNIGKAHIGEFGGAENVKKAKLEMFDYIYSNKHIFFYNSDYKVLTDAVSSYFNSIAYSETFDNGQKMQIQQSDPFITFSFQGTDISTVHLGGIHNVENIKAAIAIAFYFEMEVHEIVDRLTSFEAPANRSQWIETNNNKLFMDAYNANPSSVVMAIDYFENLRNSKKLVVLGDMFELGKYSEEEHLAIYKKLVQSDLDFYLIGDHYLNACPEDSRIFSTKFDFERELLERKVKDYSILIKASRSMKLETLVEFLQ